MAKKNSTNVADTVSTDVADYNWTNIDVQVLRQGPHIILPGEPAEMNYEEAIRQLHRRIEEEAVEYEVSEFIAGAYWDAGLAFYKAMQRMFGFVTTRGIPTWFGEIKPNLITIKTGPKPTDVVQMPQGQFTLPGFDNPIYADFNNKDGVPGYLVQSTVRRKQQAVLIKLAADAREILLHESIYRGRAVRLVVTDEGAIDFRREPEFLDLSRVSESDIVFNSETARLIETNVFTPMRKTALCRQHQIPLKRGILFEGPYGCGKSLTARVAAKVASDNDWTFITIDRAQGLRQGIEFARLFQPAMIFVEDIDRMPDRTDMKTNDLINMMDGILTKDMEIVVALTTNFIEKIDKAMLRPGRLDAVIRIDAPDAEAVRKLICHYGGALVDPGADLQRTSELLAGNVPATIREVVERAKLSMILDERGSITDVDLWTSAVGMTRHLELLAEKQPKLTAAERMAEGLREVVGVAAPLQQDKQLTARLSMLQQTVNTTMTEVISAKQEARTSGQIAAAAHEQAKVGRANTEVTLKKLDKVQRTLDT